MLTLFIVIWVYGLLIAGSISYLSYVIFESWWFRDESFLHKCFGVFALVQLFFQISFTAYLGVTLTLTVVSMMTYMAGMYVMGVVPLIIAHYIAFKRAV